MTGWIVWSGKARSGWPRRKDRHHCQSLSESLQPSHGVVGRWSSYPLVSASTDSVSPLCAAAGGPPVRPSCSAQSNSGSLAMYTFLRLRVELVEPCPARFPWLAAAWMGHGFPARLPPVLRSWGHYTICSKLHANRPCRSPLPFGAILEQDFERKSPGIAVSPTSFVNDRWTERLRRREEIIARRSV